MKNNPKRGPVFSCFWTTFGILFEVVFGMKSKGPVGSGEGPQMVVPRTLKRTPESLVKALNKALKDLIKTLKALQRIIKGPMKLLHEVLKALKKASSD